LQREKQLKKWKPVWKLDLIEEANPDWKNLVDFFFNCLDPRVREDDRPIEDG